MKILAGVQLSVAILVVFTVFFSIPVELNQDTYGETLRGFLFGWFIFLSMGYIVISLLTASLVLFRKNKPI